jgi:hypothetical protein
MSISIWLWTLLLFIARSNILEQPCFAAQIAITDHVSLAIIKHWDIASLKLFLTTKDIASFKAGGVQEPSLGARESETKFW